MWNEDLSDVPITMGRLVDAAQACAALDISERTLARWIEAGKLEAIYIKRRRYFTRKSILEMAKARSAQGKITGLSEGYDHERPHGNEMVETRSDAPAAGLGEDYQSDGNPSSR
jgi:hypothetical protein